MAFFWIINGHTCPVGSQKSITLKEKKFITSCHEAQIIPILRKSPFGLEDIESKIAWGLKPHFPS